jgi:hypothetical protein
MEVVSFSHPSIPRRPLVAAISHDSFAVAESHFAAIVIQVNGRHGDDIALRSRIVKYAVTDSNISHGCPASWRRNRRSKAQGFTLFFCHTYVR